jgi:outer membrane protein assembly factor BamD
MFFQQSRNLLIIIALITVASCSGYEKLLKSSDYKLKYEKAFEYYNDEDFVKAQTILEQLIPVYGGTKQADSVNFFHAMCYYNMQDFLLAGHYFKTFASTFGNSDFAEEAEFLSAYCHFKSSPRPSLDQASTYEAIQSFQLFLINNPNTSRKELCIKYMNELRDKLVEKSFISARLYFDLGNYKASIIALNNSLNEFPDTKFREEIMFLILKSRFLLADGSVESKRMERFQAALDEYYSFVGEFPESEYKNEAEKIFNQTSNVLRINNKDLTEIK